MVGTMRSQRSDNKRREKTMRHVMGILVVFVCGIVFQYSALAEEAGSGSESVSPQGNVEQELEIQNKNSSAAPGVAVQEKTGVRLILIDAKKGSAVATVQDLLKEAKGIFEKYKDKPKSKEKEEQIKGIVNRKFLDMEELLRLSMGVHWRLVAKDSKKRERLIRTFQNLITNNYLKKAEEYVEGFYTIQVIKGENPGALKASVHTRLFKGDVDVEVTYRLFRKAKTDAWKCCDVQLDETSLVSSYKSAFNSIISKSKNGVDTLISKMETKLKKVKGNTL